MLDDRSLFVALADAGSFARTARQLGVARSTVMRRIDALEAELGLTLVQRVSRKTVLTEAGQRYADALRPLLRELHRVEQWVLGEAKEIMGPVRFWLPNIGTSAFLAPAIARFQKTFPAVIVHVEFGRDVRHLEPGAFDVALQIGFRVNPSLLAKTMYRDKMILVASRSYIEANGAPGSVDDLASFHAIHQRDVEGKLLPWRWPDGSRAPIAPPCLFVNSVGFAFDLAKEGIGIVRIPSLLGREELRRGELVQVLPELWTEEPVNLVYLPEPTPATQAFLQFIWDWSDEQQQREAEQVAQGAKLA